MRCRARAVDVRRGRARGVCLRFEEAPVPEVVLYTKPWCAYCLRAKRLLAEKGIAYREIDVGGDLEMRTWLRHASGQGTVPQLFVDGRPYGGFRELNELERAGKLDEILRVISRQD